MADSRTDSFVFYRTYYDSIKSLKDDSDKFELLESVCDYAFDGVMPEDKKDYIVSIFEANRINIDYSLERRKTQQMNGAKGGAPYGNQNARKQPKTTENNLNGNVNVDGNEDEKENENLYLYEDVNVNPNGKENGILKNKRKRRNIKSLTPSELQSLFPEEDINYLDGYYTRLRKNNFISEITDKPLCSVDDLKEDYEMYSKEKTYV